MHTELSVYSELANLTGFASSMRGGRQENQDDFGFIDTPLGFLFVLCDGMGGGPGGKTASDIAKRAIAASITACNSLTPPEKALREAFIKANEALEKKAEADPSLKGMGSTAVALIIGKQSAYVAHLGDSRLYHLRNGKFRWRTTDHSLVNDLVQMKALTEEQARTSPQSNVITRGLGATDNHTPDITEIEYEAGDRFILCTDGIWGMLPAKELIQKLTQNTDCANLVKIIQKEIDCVGEQQGGGHDNHTIAIIDVKENSKKEEKMRKKLKAVIGVLAVICCVLLVLLVSHAIIGDKKENDKADAIYTDLLKYKQEYEEQTIISKNNTNTIESLKNTISELEWENDSLYKLTDSLNVIIKEKDKELIAKNQELEKANSWFKELLGPLQNQDKTTTSKDQEKPTTSQNPNNTEDSPKTIIDNILHAFDNIINCKIRKKNDSVEYTVAVAYIEDQYKHIDKLLEKLVSISNKYRSKVKSYNTYKNRADVVWNKVTVTNENGTIYFIPTELSIRTADSLRNIFSGLK